MMVMMMLVKSKDYNCCDGSYDDDHSNRQLYCFILIITPHGTGTKMRRILKLNQHYILSIKNGSEISKYYHYREVKRIWIERGT